MSVKLFLHKRDRRYYVRFYDAGFGRKQKTTGYGPDQKSLAVAVFHRWAADFERYTILGKRVCDPYDENRWSEYLRGGKSSIRLREAMGEWLNSAGELAEKTWRTYESIGRALCEAFPPSFLVSSLSDADVQNFLANANWKPATQASYLRRLNVFFVFCVKQGYMERVPCVKLGRVHKALTSAPNYFTESEFDILVSVMRESNAYWLVRLCVFAVYTGLRQGELLRLRWGDIRHENGRMWLDVRSDDGRRTKSGRSRRVVLSMRAYDALGDEGGRRGFIFCTEDGRPFLADFVRKRFAKFIKMAGLKGTFHTMRHTCATWLLQRGVHARYVQDMMGHSDIAVTMAYSHVDLVHYQAQVLAAFGSGRVWDSQPHSNRFDGARGAVN